MSFVCSSTSCELGQFPLTAAKGDVTPSGERSLSFLQPFPEVPHDLANRDQPLSFSTPVGVL